MNPYREVDNSMLKRVAVIAAVIGLFGAVAPNASANNKYRNLLVMTRNMDTGSDFNFVLRAKDLNSLILAVTLTYQEILASNIPERADAIAQEIQAQHPDVVSLQEVTTVLTGPFPGVATTLVDDQLEDLMAALAQRGLHYMVVEQQDNADFSLPAINPASGLFTARVKDRDVVLARADLPVSELKIEGVTKDHYNATFSITMLGQTFEETRGWIAVDVKLRGKPYRVLDTHLESVDYTIQAAQALELVNGPALADTPVVLAADINSDAESSDPVLSASYRILVNASFQDFWPIIHPGDHGFTNPLHGEDPFTPFTTPYQRIDVILTKDGGKGIDARDMFLTGNTLSNLTLHGLWASDHAGVVAAFRLLP
jgi:endonuclease/exonuclease/phosphatase family metal-dependent hydrolase